MYFKASFKIPTKDMLFTVFTLTPFNSYNLLYIVFKDIAIAIFEISERIKNTFVWFITIFINFNHQCSVEFFFIKHIKQSFKIETAVTRKQTIGGYAVVAYMVVLDIIGKFFNKVVRVIAAAKRRKQSMLWRRKECLRKISWRLHLRKWLHSND